MFKTRRVATLAAGLAVTCGTLAVACPAGASPLVLPLENWAVYGSLTPKKLNEPVVLPKGSTLNGVASLELFPHGPGTVEGTVKGKLFVPPFTASLKLVGTVPTQVGVTLTQVGEAEGTVVNVPSEKCGHARLAGLCAEIAVNSHANIGITAVGILGITVPTHCETSEPVLLPLATIVTLPELTVETHFKGTVTIPSIKCEGLQGIALAALLTTLMSGPENPYSLSLAPQEPTPPLVTSLPAASVSQISARLHGNAIPSGEPLTDCHFEFGPTTSYGTSVPCAPHPPGQWPIESEFQSGLVSGLSEGTTYHYRIMASNSLGTSVGADQALTTLTQAAAPQYGQCVAQKHGEYTDAGCAAKSKKPMKGTFEWKPGPAPVCFAHAKGEYTDASCTVKSAKPHKGSFEKQAGPRFTSTSGPIALETPGLGGGKVTCAGSTAAGEITGVNTGVERITFTGCEMAGKKCMSEGADGTPSGTAGVIESNLLDTRLLGPVEGAVWTELLSGEHQPYLAEFACEGPRLRIKGSLSGVQAGNVGVPSATSTTEFAANVGEQALLTELSENGGKSWTGPDASSFVVELTNTSELSTEIKR
jgi:hypothetical protein